MEKRFYDVPLGAYPERDRTTFRVFAPNARRLAVRWGVGLECCAPAEEIDSGLWQCEVAKDLSFFPYCYSVSCRRGSFRDVVRNQVLDPYALAACGPAGPGIVIPGRFLPSPAEARPGLRWSDLVILEGHLRDLFGLASDSADHPTYSRFGDWIKKPNNYLKELGVNCLEFLPLQQFEINRRDGYSWGYMPVNYFCPTASYATAPASGNTILEVRRLIDCCHEAGLSVLLDVVYNHCGRPNALSILGGDYYFRTENGKRTNFSGCGNDFRSEAPMGRRLILDSLRHWLTVYGVDGFRFDLAELIDQETLLQIEQETRKFRQETVLIAEPWSFRGQNVDFLRTTGWAYWNDDYRNYLRAYILGEVNGERLRYFLLGSLAGRSRFPTQSVNYTSSHDDFCWIDSMTEKPNHDGRRPTHLDEKRTRIMFGLLFCSLGIPMFAQGQDFLHSKRGHGNTYNRADLNRLCNERLQQFPSLHRYVRDWIEFRSSERGSFLRREESPPANFLEELKVRDSDLARAFCFHPGDGKRWLLLVNPERRPVQAELPVDSENFSLVATETDFCRSKLELLLKKNRPMPPVSLELWACESCQAV